MAGIWYMYPFYTPFFALLDNEKSRKRKASETTEPPPAATGNGEPTTGNAVVKDEEEEEPLHEFDAPENGDSEDKEGGEGESDETKGGSAKKGRERSSGSNTNISRRSGARCSDVIVLGLPYTLEAEELREYFEKEFGPLIFYEVCYLFRILRGICAKISHFILFIFFHKKNFIFR
jgi:hypothetical protein